MANIIWTPPSGWVEETGAHVSFKAPCDCKVAGSLVIGSNSYSIVDALGNVITGTGGAFASGAVLDFILDCENSKAYLQNAATGLTLLWTNPNWNTNFAAQTVSLNLSGYTAIMTVFAYATTVKTHRGTQTQLVDGATYTFEAQRRAGDNYWFRREVTASTTGVTFGTGGYFEDGSFQGGNLYTMPLYIYGIK